MQANRVWVERKRQNALGQMQPCNFEPNSYGLMQLSFLLALFYIHMKMWCPYKKHLTGYEAV